MFVIGPTITRIVFFLTLISRPPLQPLLMLEQEQKVMNKLEFFFIPACPQPFIQDNCRRAGNVIWVSIFSAHRMGALSSFRVES